MEERFFLRNHAYTEVKEAVSVRDASFLLFGWFYSCPCTVPFRYGASEDVSHV